MYMRIIGFVFLLGLIILTSCASSLSELSISTLKTNMQPADSCASFDTLMKGQWPDQSTRVIESHWISKGSDVKNAFGIPVKSPAHCEVVCVMNERPGIDGQHYAVRFHLRMPQQWNQRFFFQGGGGTNGNLGDALGATGIGSNVTALEQGYAVVSQDSGHDNAVNTVDTYGGTCAFGFDPQARANYGGLSLKPVAEAAKTAIYVFYGSKPKKSYFYGCSKGGQEGMMFAQRYPEEFDGIVAAAPGFSLPRAAVAEMWDLQAFAGIASDKIADPGDPERLRESFSDSELNLVHDAIIEACDADDGLRDGITANFEACTWAHVEPSLNARTCSSTDQSPCLKPKQIAALARVFAGAHDSKGTQLYSDWPLDAGLGSTDWRLWKLGTADGSVPCLNLVLGAVSMASIFTTPPTPLISPPEPTSASLRVKFQYALQFDFDKDAKKIYATNQDFSRSAWQDIGARSPDLSAFRERGGKLIVPHGVSDPAFSINDTLAWYREVDEMNHGKASDFVRVFPVPGMSHCSCGPATDEFDAFTALVNWVEKGEAPDSIPARAGDQSPWPGRTRPLCPYPKIAKYIGTGSVDDAANFYCEEP
jgi:hypothetical protein